MIHFGTYQDSMGKIRQDDRLINRKAPFALMPTLISQQLYSNLKPA